MKFKAAPLILIVSMALNGCSRCSREEIPPPPSAAPDEPKSFEPNDPAPGIESEPIDAEPATPPGIPGDPPVDESED